MNATFKKVIRKLPRTFWVSNVMELFERWAWYGFYNALALYLTLSKDTGALGFTQGQKGLIMGTGTMLLYFLPLITGAIADKLGYKKILILSFTMYMAGYFMMGTFESYEAIFLAYLFLAVSGALFKPIISAMIAKTTDKETSSIGFGIFYMMINIGGFIGPLLSGLLYKVSWNYVFLMSIVTIGMNYIFVFFFFKEPERENNDDSLGETLRGAFRNILITLGNFKYVLFLIIMGFYWTAYNQLFYSFPVFLEDWVDLNKLALSLGLEKGSITAITMTGLVAMSIILFQLLVSSVTMRYKPLNSMMVGTFILGGGLALMFSSPYAWIVLLGIWIFSIGEMASSPKFTEYIGRIAPEDQKALYMGTSFLPVAAGHFLAGFISGNLYANIAEKITLLKAEVVKRGLSIPEISETFTRQDYIEKAKEMMDFTDQQLTDFLWHNYHPSHILFIFSGIAVGTAIALFLYDKFLLKSPSGRK